MPRIRKEDETLEQALSDIRELVEMGYVVEWKYYPKAGA